MISISGWLKKKGLHQGYWHKRFGVLIGKELTLSKDEQGKVLDFSITLTSANEPSLVEGAATPRFVITIPGQDPIILNADTRENALRWIKAIKSATAPSHTLTMESFNIISVLGRGFFGKVMLCQSKITNELYAIKTIRKSRVTDQSKLVTIFSERNIMSRARHPFIVNLSFSFQTDAKFYIGMEYASGGELHYHMKQNGKINLHDVKIYTAEIGTALSFLHHMCIVYRDLKPENVLFDDLGHVKLADFGLAKDLHEFLTTSTFCGTTEYLSPEMVKGEPYTVKIDIWALGILVYEMLLGTTPFYDENRFHMLNKIVNSDPVYPDDIDPIASSFINRLLIKDPKNRPSFDDLKSDPFFEGFDWDKILERKYQPNYVPPAHNPLNPINFDPEFTQEVAADSFVSATSCNDLPGFSFIEQDLTK